MNARPRITSVSVHESSHAVCAWALGLDVQRVVAIGPDPHCELDNGSICTDARDYAESLSFLRERLAIVSLAGDIAEGGPVRQGSDYQNAWRLILDDLPGFFAEARMEYLQYRTTELVRRHREAILQVAAALDVRGSLSSAEFLMLVEAKE